jgi:hypothetical protein
MPDGQWVSLIKSGWTDRFRPMVGVKTAFTLLLTVSLLGIAACGNDDADGTGTTAEKVGEPILIKTHVVFDAEGKATGKVLAGSTIGGTAFCAGGTFSDSPGAPDGSVVLRAFQCPNGTLEISFRLTGTDRRQNGKWKVGTGFRRFEGLSGGGRMRVVFSSKREGRETLTGTVTG